MTRRLLYTCGLIAFVVVVFGSSPASAQTSSNGPYYATPSWDQKLQCDTLSTCPRFIVLANWNSDAVLDRETGLVWEKVPRTTAVTSWWAARNICADKLVGGRKGWRLPSVMELASLVDTANSNPALPTGHPFSILPSAFYWSATTQAGFVGDASNVTTAWFVAISVGQLGIDAKTSANPHVWCVRGGMNADAY